MDLTSGMSGKACWTTTARHEIREHCAEPQSAALMLEEWRCARSWGWGSNEVHVAVTSFHAAVLGVGVSLVARLSVLLLTVLRFGGSSMTLFWIRPQLLPPQQSHSRTSYDVWGTFRTDTKLFGVGQSWKAFNKTARIPKWSI